MTDANEALTEDTVMGIIYAAKLHNELGFCREDWKDGIDVTKPSYALMRFAEAIRKHLTDPGYVRVPVEQLRKLEESRVRLWEFLDDRLGEMDKAVLQGITGQIWRVANTKCWEKPMLSDTKEASHD